MAILCFTRLIYHSTTCYKISLLDSCDTMFNIHLIGLRNENMSSWSDRCPPPRYQLCASNGAVFLTKQEQINWETALSWLGLQVGKSSVFVFVFNFRFVFFPEEAPETMGSYFSRCSERSTGFDSEAAKHGGCWLDNLPEHLCLSSFIAAVSHETGIINV